MKSISRTSIFIIVISLSCLTGCATNRGIVSLHLPEEFSQEKSNGKYVLINSVVDNREFQENPKTQKIPSLGFGGAEKTSNIVKKRAIARKRNSFGKAMGDILLEDGQTVETVIRESLERSFVENGYQLVDKTTNINTTTFIVDATIEKFWAYMTPGFWAITLNSEISTNIKIKENGKNGIIDKEITVQSEGQYQVASGSNWIEIIQKSIQQYIDEAKKLI